MNCLRIEGLSPDGLDGKLLNADTGEELCNVHSVTIKWQRGELFPVADIEFVHGDEDNELDAEIELDQGWLLVDMDPLSATLERIE